MCKKRRAYELGFCSESCLVNAQNKAPCILPVPEEHAIFKNGKTHTILFYYYFSDYLQYFEVRKQFTSSWRHPVPEIPAVRFVYKVISTKVITDKYESYK